VELRRVQRRTAGLADALRATERADGYDNFT
jgi:hypothetical protein